MFQPLAPLAGNIRMAFAKGGKSNRGLFGDRKSRKAAQEFGPGRKDFVLCPVGGEAYFKKSWHASLSESPNLSESKGIQYRLCPFHQMVKNKQFEGEIIIENVPDKNRDELVRLIERGGEHATRSDPMDRIIRIEAKKGTIRVETSENQMAQKIANKIRSRFSKTRRRVSRGKGNSDVVRIRISF